MTTLNVRLRGLALGSGLVIALLTLAGQATAIHAAPLRDHAASAGRGLAPGLGGARCGSTHLADEASGHESIAIACEPRERDPARRATSNAGQPPEPGVAEVPPPGGLAAIVAGTANIEALIGAQRFAVAAVWKLNTGTQAFEVYIPGAPSFAISLHTLDPSDVVLFKRRARGFVPRIVHGNADTGVPDAGTRTALVELPATGRLAGSTAAPPPEDDRGAAGQDPTTFVSTVLSRGREHRPGSGPTRSHYLLEIDRRTFAAKFGETTPPEFRSHGPSGRAQVQQAAYEQYADAAEGAWDELAGGTDGQNGKGRKRPGSGDLRSRGALASVARSGGDG